MNKKHSLAIFLILISLITLAQQQGTIRGNIVDKVTGFPLIGASIILQNSNPINGTTADINGNFMMENVPFGRQEILISFLGYKQQNIPNLLITTGKQTHINILLEEDITAVEEVVVTARANKMESLNKMASVSARSFSIEQTERFAGSLGDPARMVSNYAGVNMSDDSRNDIVIRGNSPIGVLWRLEGIEIPNPNHFGALGTTGGPISMINNNQLTNSDFFTGAFPAEYGNAIAGAFDLNMRSGNSHKTEFTGQIGFNGFEAGVEGPLFKTSENQKASYLVNFRYSTLEVFHKMGFDFGTGTAVPQYKDLSYIINIPTAKAGHFRVFGLWGNSYIELGRDFADTTSNNYTGHGQAINFGSELGVAGASHTYFFNKNIKIENTLSFQTTNSQAVVDSVKERKYIKPCARQDQREDKYSWSSKLTYKLNKHNNINAGFIADYFVANYIDSAWKYTYNKFLPGNDINEDMSLFQAFTQWRHHFNDNLSTYVGIHGQYFSLNNDIAIEPRLGVKWQLSTRHSLNAGFGIHSQTQPKTIYFEQTYNPTNNTSFTTNENLAFTKSNHYIFGHNYQISKNFRAKTEVYYQYLYNVPVKSGSPEFSMLNTGASFGGDREDSLVNKGTGTNYGIEITIEKYLSSGYYFLFTTSLYESKYKGYNGIERNTAFNGNYVFNLLAGYEYIINDKFMLTFDTKTTWAGGKRYVPLDVNQSEIDGGPVYNWSKAYEEQYSPYFRTDFRIGIKHNSKRYSQEWAIDLQNLTNYQSVFMQSYDSEENEVYNTYQQEFMPMVMYRILF